MDYSIEAEWTQIEWQLFRAVNEADRIGGGDFASGAGFLRSLSNHPARLYLLNEFGLMLTTSLLTITLQRS